MKLSSGVGTMSWSHCILAVNASLLWLWNFHLVSVAAATLLVPSSNQLRYGGCLDFLSRAKIRDSRWPAGLQVSPSLNPNDPSKTDSKSITMTLGGKGAKEVDKAIDGLVNSLMGHH